MSVAIHRLHTSQPKILALLLLVFLLAACTTPTAPPPTETAAPAEPLPAEVVESTPTGLPATPKVVLVTGPDSSQAASVETLLNELAAESGVELEVRPSLSPGEVQKGWQVVALLSPPADLPALAGSAPDTQFVVVSAVDIEPAGNVSVIRVHPEYQAFAAGFIAAAITSDWRAAGLFAADTPLGNTLGDAFRNGGAYYCGRCSPLYAPYVRFPVPVSLPAASSLADWQNVANELSQSVVYTVYVSPEVSTPELLYDLGSRGFFLFGGQSPLDEVRPRWALTLHSDVAAALRELWPALLAGEGGQVVSARLTFTDVNPEIFTPGKQLMAEEVLKWLTAGLIYPFNP